jgi:hypothetical protein
MESGMQQIIKNVLRTVSPGAYTSLKETFLSRRNARIETVKNQLIGKFGLQVCDGPFAGMLYVADARPVLLPAKQIGAYEAELHKTVDKIIQTKYPTIIDVGCAEGYYAVGLAMQIPDATVYAFDIDLNGQKWCPMIAEANGVGDRVKVEAECNHERLRQLPLEGSLLFSDCEGYELELLQPDAVPALKNCDVLVELHDEFDPSLTETILARFKETHDITVIQPEHRTVEEFKSIQFLSPSDQKIAVSDFRGGDSGWAFMVAKNKA